MGKIRYLQEKIIRLTKMFPIVAIIGARQCGKSTLAKQLYPNWKYYDLESPDDYQLITDDPIAFFEINRQQIIINEVQQYPEIFKILRGVIDSDRQNKGRFLLTGSSSPQIIKGIIESLAGRIATVELSPFKVGEYHATPPSNLYKIITQTPLDIKNLNTLQPIVSLEKSMSCWYLGGFPEPLIGQQLNGYHKQWMENYISNYFNRDIITLFPRLNIHKFRRFLTLLAQYSGHQLNMSNMARSLEVSVSSIKDYLDIIHQTFIWRNLDSFDKNSLKKVQKAKKGFFRDQGLLHYYLKINSLDDLLLHPVAEFSFESFVIEEIIRGLQSTMATQLEFNYYRTIDKSEIDLIIQGDFGTIPIEIKLNSSIKKIALRSLSNFLNDLNLPLGIVINRSKKIEQLTDKIFQIPVNYL